MRLRALNAFAQAEPNQIPLTPVFESAQLQFGPAKDKAVAPPKE